jgi:lipopolysaccharide biosynthesis glycosyltransferase
MPFENSSAPQAQAPQTQATIDIAMGFDHRYIPHSANVMSAIMRHAPGAPVRFILLTSGLTDAQKAGMEAVAKGAKFVWVEVGDDDLPAYADRGHLNRTVLFRLGLEWMAPADCHRVIYIDGDTIVMGDVRELWAADLGDHAIGAVSDHWADNEAFAKLWNLPLDGARYFNAGMQVIDLDKVKAGKLFSKALDFVIEHDKKLLFGDQDALNYVFWKNAAVIDPTWNVQRFQTAGELAAETRADRKWGKPTPRMIHYIGTEKPWARNVWHPWAWAYWENLRRTPYLKEVQATYRMDTAQLLRQRLRWLLRRPAGTFLQ